MPPRKPQPWTGVRDVNTIGLRAPQLENPRVPEWFVFDRSEPQGEDCLVLNVYTPSLADGRKRPVMVWLHGGGFVGGSSGFTVYEGQNLVGMRDVVLVHLNHRLNLFGFLYLGDAGGERYADANAGMLDIVAALEWVRDNIANFGGDPANVTVFGQSGGGSKVSTLLGMPAAKGLFHKAIAMSGTQVRSLTREQATATTERVLAALGLGTDRLDELHRVPMRRLRDLLARRWRSGLHVGAGGGWPHAAGASVRSCGEPTRRRRAAADRVHRNRSHLERIADLRSAHRRRAARRRHAGAAHRRRRRRSGDCRLPATASEGEQPRSLSDHRH